jgi:hypothetical protein
VDDPEKPRFDQVLFFEAEELRDRFDRAYQARRKAHHSISLGRGLWLSLYGEDNGDVYHVGAGIGRAHSAVARLPLYEGPSASDAQPSPVSTTETATSSDDHFEPLTIAQAKIRLARTLGVEPGSIKILVEA